MERRDWVLLALLAAPDKRLQPVQLQKSLFLLQQRGGTLGSAFYAFRPYHYGPFSREVYDDADTLAIEGMLQVDHAPGSYWREYSATEEGLTRARCLSSEAKPEAWAYLQRAVLWVTGLSFNELVRSIYVHFPEYRVNSVFQNEDGEA